MHVSYHSLTSCAQYCRSCCNKGCKARQRARASNSLVRNDLAQQAPDCDAVSPRSECASCQCSDVPSIAEIIAEHSSRRPISPRVRCCKWDILGKGPPARPNMELTNTKGVSTSEDLASESFYHCICSDFQRPSPPSATLLLREHGKEDRCVTAPSVCPNRFGRNIRTRRYLLRINALFSPRH